MPLLLLLVLLPLVLVAGAIALIAKVVRWGPRLMIASLGALIAMLVLHGGQGWVALAVFVAVLFASRGRRSRGRAPRASDRVVENGPESRRPALPGPDWAALRRLGDWGTRRRIDAARASCERYLMLAETQEEPSAQLPIRLAKHLPTLLDDCVRHCRTATPAEARALVTDTVATIEGLAARAEARRLELAHQAQGQFRTLQAHLATPED